MYRDETKWNEMSRTIDITVKDCRDSDRLIYQSSYQVSEWLSGWMSEWMSE